MKHCLSLWLLLLLLIHLPGAARATAGPPATGRPLAEALNADGTLRAGAAGSFDARAFRMRTAPDGRPVFRPAGTAGAGDERWADGFGMPNGVDGFVTAVVRFGTDIYVGGSFRAVGNLIANNVAKWNGTAWSSLGTSTANGVNGGTVAALAVAGNGEVYVGGTFTQAGGIAASKVARWNGTAWSPLGTGALNGLDTGGSVTALAVAGADVYVGGGFFTAGGVPANSVAKWNGTAWSALGTGAANGTNGAVTALAVASNGSVYVGGNFIEAGGARVNRIAKWNGTVWSPLGTGVSNGPNGQSVGDVYALAVASTGEVYVGGKFQNAGGVAANNIAKWNGTAWTALGTGVSNGTDEAIYALATAANDEVYVSGSFVRAGGVVANHVAQWSGTAWAPLGTGAATIAPYNLYVRALAVASNGEVYMGGTFTQADGTEASNVAKWTGMGWSPLSTGTGTNGMNSVVTAVAVAGNGDVYVGGEFTQAGGVAVNRVAKWNGTAWSALGTGATNGANGSVGVLAIAGNGDVYAGGRFTQAGGVAANYIAKWNGAAWAPLGTGLADANGFGFVSAIVVASSGELYVGGRFQTAGGLPANYVAKWNGTAWRSLGTGATNGVNGGVNALAIAGNGEVYVGGFFYQAGGLDANNVAKWNGTAWSALGTGAANGVDIAVNTLAVASNGNVYVGGAFRHAGGIVANYVAKWDGTAWGTLGAGATNGVGGYVYNLVLASNGDLYAGGFFYLWAGARAQTCVAKWDGTAWSALGTGLENTVITLAVGPTGKLYAGGEFATTGDGSKAMARFAIYDPNAPLATSAAKATPAAQLFPNPAHGTATLRLPAGAARQPLALRDALGRLVREYPAPTGPEAVLDLRGLSAGVYWVRCGALSQRVVVE